MRVGAGVQQPAVSGDSLKRLRDMLDRTEAVLIGAGAGLSASAGFVYSGPRFEEYFGDFIERYGFQDMYTAGFYPYQTLEEQWAFWSRYIYINRYQDPPRDTYGELLRLVEGRDYFVLTTNVDHCFQKAGFDKTRLFYTQGDYGLWQCSRPCHQRTYDNEAAVRAMVAQQKDMRIPSELVPYCPVCGAPMSMNLRGDDTFVEDEGWHRAADRYGEFLRRHRGMRVLYLELGVGGNTPGIIKYPFWKMVRENPNGAYASINLYDIHYPAAIQGQAVGIQGDIGAVLKQL